MSDNPKNFDPNACDMTRGPCACGAWHGEGVQGQTPAAKPPLGLMPRWLYDEICHAQRANDLRAAIDRYRERSWYVPDEWLAELRERDALAAAKGAGEGRD